jgi:hypothetical protein
MYLDKSTLLSDSQAVTATAASTNHMDLQALAKTGYLGIQLNHKVGVGKIPFLIQVVEDFATLTSLKIAIESDDNDSFSSPKELIAETVAVADLKAGYVSNIRQLPVIKERYFRVKYTVNGSNATAGKIVAGVTNALDESK